MKFQEKATQLASRFMGLNIFMWLTMLVLFAGILFLAAAAYMAIALVLAPALAALLTGVGLLVVFCLLVVVVRRQLRPEPASKHPAETAIETNEPAIGDHPVNWLRNNPDIALAGALVTGIVLTASPSLRRLAVRALGSALGARAMRAATGSQTRHPRRR